MTGAGFRQGSRSRPTSRPKLMTKCIDICHEAPMFQTSRFAAVAIALQAVAVLAPTATWAQAVAPARCPQGQVWREAFPDDYLCVAPQVRAKARAHTCPPGQVPQADGTCAPLPAAATAMTPAPMPAP